MEKETDGSLTREELIEKMRDFLNADDIEMSREEISVRDLRDIFAKKFENLNDAKKRLIDPKFLCTLSCFLGRTCFEEVGGLFMNENVMSFCLQPNNNIFSIGPLYRRFGEGEKFYYRSNDALIDEKMKMILYRNSDKIERIFDEIELLKDLPLSFTFSVKDDIFTGNIGYHDFDTPKAWIDINSGIASKDIITMVYNDRPSIKSIIESFTEDFLGKISISVNELPVAIQELIGEELEKREAIKLEKRF